MSEDITNNLSITVRGNLIIIHPLKNIHLTPDMYIDITLDDYELVKKDELVSSKESI